MPLITILKLRTGILDFGFHGQGPLFDLLLIINYVGLWIT